MIDGGARCTRRTEAQSPVIGMTTGVSQHTRFALTICLALGGAAGLSFGLSFLPWGLVDGTGAFWQSTESDRGAALIGYLYFVADTWRWPLGAIGTLSLPEGTNIVFTDSVPLLALAMKILHGFGVPPWNYFGAWLLCCYAMNGVAMALVLWLAGVRSRVVHLLAALLAAGMPVLLHRWYHSALCGHFLLVLALSCYVGVADARRSLVVLRAAALLVVASLLVHPYLWAMVFALYLATLARAARGAVPLRRVVGHGVSTSLTLAVLMVVVGFVSFGGPRIAAGGFGHFSANLLSPFTSSLAGLMPQAWERLRLAETSGSAWPFYDGAWPDATGGQSFEGFGYLGIGLLLLCAIHAPYIVRNSRELARSHWPLLSVLAATTLFALSSRVYVGDRLVVDVPVPMALGGLAGVFRSSGRFLWLAAYAALVAATILTVRRFGAARGATILAAALALQWFDATPLRRAIALDARSTHAAGLPFEGWRGWLAAGFDRIYILPSYHCGDPHLGNPKTVMQYYIARVGPVPTNSASTARGRTGCADEFRLLDETAEGRRVAWLFFADGASRPEVERFRAAAGTTCQTTGGVVACTRRKSASAGNAAPSATPGR